MTTAPFTNATPCPPPAGADANFATTLAHGLALLSAFDSSGAALSNGDLANRIGLSRSTVSRLCSTLETLGYLRRDARGRFKPGAKVLAIAYPALAGLKIRQRARPLLRDFAAYTGSTVSIAMPLGLDCIYVETMRTVDVSSHVPETGFVISMIPTAVGRALLSLYTASELSAFYQAAETRKVSQWEHFRPRIEKGIADCHNQGFCVSLGEWRPEIFAAAAPLLRTADGDCLAVNCGIPAYRFTAEAVERECGPRMAALAASIRALIENDDLAASD